MSPGSPVLRRWRQPAPGRAFTLLEVLLAVAIAGALLAVALFFYRQTSVFRDGVLQEMGRLGSARLVMSRLATELTCLAPEAGALQGSASEIRFAFAAVRTGDAGEGGLRQVRYALPEPDPAAEPEALPGPLQRQETELVTEAPSAAGAADTNLVTFGSLLEESQEPPPPSGQTAIAEVNFFRLRYWDGADWQEEWSAAEPPLGVEVTLGFEPLDPETAPEDYPHEVFRRLIALPVTGPAAVASNGPQVGPGPGRGRGRPGGSEAESSEGSVDDEGGAGAEPPPPGSGRGGNRGRRRG